MQIDFDIAGQPATFSRSATTGRAELLVDGAVTLLQDPMKFSTHFDLATEQSWVCDVAGHQVKVVKRRPQLVGGFRKNTFTISVDDAVVAAAEGR
jgi:hypothetical protein